MARGGGQARLGTLPKFTGFFFLKPPLSCPQVPTTWVAGLAQIPIVQLNDSVLYTVLLNPNLFKSLLNSADHRNLDDKGSLAINAFTCSELWAPIHGISEIHITHYRVFNRDSNCSNSVNIWARNSAFRYGGTHSRDQQQGKGPYTPCEVVKMTPKQVLTSTNHFLAKFYPILI